MILYDGNVTAFCQVVPDDEDILTSMSYDTSTGASWGYFINSGDYKLEYENDSVVAYILVAGVSKKNVKAFMEGKLLSVTTDKPGWNGNVNVEIDLTAYRVNEKDPSIKLANGVLRIEFSKVDEKVNLEIK
jgi:HSP20 family molecular chaperone IbpA